MAITQMRKHLMVAEEMRILFKFSEALEQEPGNDDEARTMREEAERLLSQRAPNYVDPGLERTYDSLILIEWR
jgi:hypothetical protein